MISRRFTWVQLAAALCVGIPQTALAEDAQMLKVEEIEQAPVNCATAEGDLRVLQSERDHAENTKATGVTAITPSGVLIGIPTVTESRKLQILSGDYIKHIDATMANIKATCNL